MSILTEYHPFTQGYDLAREFFTPSKKDQSIYEPLVPDFGSILTATIRNGANFNSRKGANKFDHVNYFLHFFLALLCTGQESKLKNELGLKSSFWYFDKANEQLKVFTTHVLNGRKIMNLKTVNFRPENQHQKHEWSDIDLKNVFFLMEKENLAAYTINSHWYDVWAENLESSNMEKVLVPSFVFTSDVKNDMKINAKLVDSNLKKKFRKNFHRIDTDDKQIAQMEDLFRDLASEDKVKMARSFDKLLDKIVKLHKKNLFGTIGEEMQSLKSVSQCAFTHGALLALKKQLPVKLRVEQIRFSDPSYRIRMSWTLKNSWKDVMSKWPMQIDFIPNLDQLGTRRETILDDVLASSLEMDDEMTAETFKDRTMVGYLNFNADKGNKLILETKVVPPTADTINYARSIGAITLTSKIVDRLNALKIFLDSTLSYTLSTHLPTYKVQKSRYMSNYLHGYIASSEFLSQPNGAAYKIQLKNPSTIEKQTMTSFMMSTVDESVDLIFNIYEMDTFLPQDYAHIAELANNRKYPKTGEKVTLSVIYDFYLSFSIVKKKEFKNHILPNSQCYMKSIPKDGETNFEIRKIEHVDFVGQFANYDGAAKNRRLEDKETLLKIKQYFDDNFLHVKDKYEMKAVIDGLLHKVKVIPNVVDMRKNVLQAAFMDEKGEKMNLLNFAYGKSRDVIEGLDDVKDFVDSDVLKDKEKVKSMNLAVIDDHELEKESMVSRNDFLTVLAVCQKMSTARTRRDAKCMMDDEVKKFLPKMEDNDVGLKPTKSKIYLENLSKLSSGIMFGLMAKDFVSDLIHGNIAGLAVNAGFIISNILAGHLAQRLMSKGTMLAQEDKLLLANILKIGGPFLRRLPSFAFVGLDLYNSIVAYKSNQSEALVNIGADGGYLALDVAETAIEVAETFGLIEGVSAITGPIGWTFGAALLVGSDVYRSVKKVEHLDNVVHLTKTEKFTEGVRSFFGMDPEQHIEKLMTQKTTLQGAIEENLNFLLQHDTITSYIFPVNLEKSEKTTLIDLQQERKFVKSRAIPDFKNYACLPPLQDGEPSGIFKGYLCTNSVGLESTNQEKIGTLVYIQVASGSTLIRGHLQNDNVYDLIGNGTKIIHGTVKDDTLILRSCNVSGIFLGSGGVNMVDVSKLNLSKTIHFTGEHVSWARKRGFFYSNVTAIIGRKNEAEKVVAWCQLTHIELHGGDQVTDRIHIPKAHCSYNMTILISGNNTWLSNAATRGLFTYVISDIGSLFFKSSANDNQTVLLNYASADIEYINVKFGPDYSMVHINFSQNAVVLFEVHTMFPPLILFKDASILLLNNDRAILNITTILSIDQAFSVYSPLSIKSNISCIIHSTTENVTATLHNHHMKKNTGVHAVDIVFSSTTNYGFKSLAHELVYIVDEFRKLTDIKIHVKAHQKVVIDLNKPSQTEKLTLRAHILKLDVIMDITSISNQLKSSRITLKHAMKNSSFENIVIRKRSTYILQTKEDDNASLILVPIPLQFEKGQNLIVLNSQDGLDVGSEVHFARSLTTKLDFFHMNNTDLMLTNVLNTEIENALFVEDQFTIILKDFFVDEIMQSLNLVFQNDRKISLATVDRIRFKPIDYLFTVLNANTLLDV
uniref:Uncharacterized protein n=1 Tax=Romanomermis culicivorax TaxID=13658 RepID=A0A915JQI7_ROMCU